MQKYVSEFLCLNSKHELNQMLTVAWMYSVFDHCFISLVTSF